MKTHLHFFTLIFFVLFSNIYSQENSFFNYADFKFSSNISLPKVEDKEEDFTNYFGAKFSFKNADLRFYDSYSKNEKWEKERFGAGFFLFKEKFPITIKIGKNTFSKSISKIKNPSPSFIANPLTKSFAFSTGLGCSLPTLTSTQQKNSATIGFNIEEKFFIPVSFEVFADEDKNSGASISFSKNFSRFNSIKASFTGSRFFIENNSSILKKANAQFEGDYLFSELSEFSFRIPFFKSNFRLGFQESPYENDSIWFNWDSRIIFGYFLVDFSYFAIPTTKTSPKVAPIISASSSIERTVEQAGINPQIIIPFNNKKNSTIRLGFHAIESWKIAATKNAELLNVGKIRAATSFEQRNLDFRYDFTFANFLISGKAPNKSTTPEKYYSNDFLANFRFKLANISTNFGIKYFPPYSSKYEPKKNFDSSISISTGKNKFLTTKSTISTIYKGSLRTYGKISNSASLKFRTKKINSTFKCEIEVPF